MIYLWKTNLLTDDLKNNKLSQTEKFIYFFIYIVINTTWVEFSPGVEGYDNTYLIVVSLLTLAITIAGLLLCYRTNQSGDNKEFIERYFCLSLPIGVKLIALFLSISLIYNVLYTTLFNSLENLEQHQDTLIMALIIMFSLLFYWRLYFHIKIISHENSN